jgi:hypothetical protein
MATAKTATRNGRTLVDRLLPVVLPVSVSAGLILGSRPRIEDLTGDLEAGGADGWWPRPPQVRCGLTAVTATLSRQLLTTHRERVRDTYRICARPSDWTDAFAWLEPFALSFSPAEGRAEYSGFVGKNINQGMSTSPCKVTDPRKLASAATE